jgi:hypothetical protein
MHVMTGCLALLMVWPSLALAERASCKQTCEAERSRIQKELAACLERIDPLPKDRAAKMKILCREKYVPPRCEGLPPCKTDKLERAYVPGISLGTLIFSAEKRGKPMQKPIFAAGSEFFMSLDLDVAPKPSAKQIWLQLDLRILRPATGKEGKELELLRWEDYFEEQKIIDPEERGMSKHFSIHGGGKLPLDWDAGQYLLQADVRERTSDFKQSARGTFTVIKKRPGS